MNQLSPQATTREAATPRLRRVLTVWDLVFYGIVLVQPIAPIPLFGVAQKLSDGHYVTTLLLAMFPMLITAASYGRMAAIYPSAGSAYTYVGKGLNAYLGFLVGWAMLLDYLLFPGQRHLGGGRHPFALSAASPLCRGDVAGGGLHDSP